jgi:hypothetical protein
MAASITRTRTTVIACASLDKGPRASCPRKGAQTASPSTRGWTFLTGLWDGESPGRGGIVLAPAVRPGRTWHSMMSPIGAASERDSAPNVLVSPHIRMYLALRCRPLRGSYPETHLSQGSRLGLFRYRPYRGYAVAVDGVENCLRIRTTEGGHH